MPPVRLKYLLELWAECGLSADWKTVKAWAETTGTPICQWEATAIRDMSGQYRAAQSEYEGTTHAPPWLQSAQGPVTGSILARARRG